jgi:hypothetical protein
MMLLAAKQASIAIDVYALDDTGHPGVEWPQTKSPE